MFPLLLPNEKSTSYQQNTPTQFVLHPEGRGFEALTAHHKPLQNQMHTGSLAKAWSKQGTLWVRTSKNCRRRDTVIMPLDARDKVTLDSLENRFTYHAPRGDQPARYEKLRGEALVFARLIVESCPPSPERSTALTHLDAVVMFANAAIARNEG